MVQPFAQMQTTVAGVPLQPGERVVYYAKPDFSGNKTALLIIGILLLIIVVGVLFLFARARVDKRNPRAFVVTTQRVIVVQGNGDIDTMWLRDIAGIRAIRFKSRSRADQLAPSHPGFWNLAIGMVLSSRQGGELTVRCQDRPKEIWSFGAWLARGLAQGGFEQAPTVGYEA